MSPFLCGLNIRMACRAPISTNSGVALQLLQNPAMAFRLGFTQRLPAQKGVGVGQAPTVLTL